MTRFDGAYNALLHDTFEPAIALARQGKTSELAALFETRAPPLFQAVIEGNRDLVARQVQVGQDSYQQATANLHWRLIAGLLSTAAGLCAMFASFRALHIGVARPIKSLESHLRAVTRGDVTREIQSPSVNEFRGAFAMLRAMRAHLAFAEWQRRELERRSDAVRHPAWSKPCSAHDREAESTAGGGTGRTKRAGNS